MMNLAAQNKQRNSTSKQQNSDKNPCDYKENTTISPAKQLQPQPKSQNVENDSISLNFTQNPSTQSTPTSQLNSVTTARIFRPGKILSLDISEDQRNHLRLVKTSLTETISNQCNLEKIENDCDHYVNKNATICHE